MILDWILWLVYGAAVIGVAKLLNDSVFKNSPVRTLTAWLLTAAMFVTSFVALFLLKVLTRTNSGSPFDSLGLAVLFSWLFFACLARQIKPSQ
jgi:hypothetical protein